MKEYRESQKFNHWWLWLLNLSLFVGLIVFGLMNVEVTGWMEALIGPAILGLVMILLAILELRTVITEDGIEVKFWPFGKKRIFKSEIKNATVRKYSPIGEFGGWGYRIGRSGKAFNMYGSQGLQLEMKGGEKLLVGTQRPEELAAFLQQWQAEKSDTLTDEEVTLELKELRKNRMER